MDVLAGRSAAEFRKERFWNVLRARISIGEVRVTLIKPLSYVWIMCNYHQSATFSLCEVNQSCHDFFTSRSIKVSSWFVS